MLIKNESEVGTTAIAPTNEVAVKTSWNSITKVFLLFAVVFSVSACSENEKVKPSDRKDFGVSVKFIDLQNKTDRYCGDKLDDVHGYMVCTQNVKIKIDAEYSKLDNSFLRGGQK